MNHAHIDYTVHAPEAYQHLLKLSGQLHKGPLGHKLVELISLRVSQINGCAYCLDMHSSALRKAGVAQRKLDTLAAWRESPFFEARERAALGWAEALNRIGTAHMPETALEALQPHFNEREISELTFTVAMITSWNMLSIGLGKTLPET